MACGGLDHARSSGSAGGSGHDNKINQVCRYFLHGACNRGDSCKFLHDKSRSVPADNICRYYLAGTCVYGDRCRYDHVQSKFASQSRSGKKEQVKKLESPPSRMVSLTKGGFKHSLELASKEEKKEAFEKKWVEAQEFVPGQRFQSSLVPGSYSQAVDPEIYGAVGGFDHVEVRKQRKELTEDDLLCPYFAHDGYCPYEDCQYAHGDICDMCGLPMLHPKNAAQRELHIKECLEGHTRDMELAFLVKDSGEKECGICLEVIKDKTAESSGAPVDRRFGILENCNHCFCLSCIKEWRQKRCAEKNTHRSCPVCRTHSNFVTPSEFWVEEEDKKAQLIADYKAQIGKKPCQYFKQGKGECPFYDKCFYLHALPDGSIAPPQPRPKRRRLYDALGEDSNMEAYSLWDYFASRDVDDSLMTNLLSLDDELSLILLEALHSDDEDDFTFTDSSADSD